MSLNNILVYLTLWSLIGCLLFTVFVVVVFRSGLVYLSRKDDGTLKEKIPLRGYIIMFAFLLVIVGFLVLSNYISLFRKSIEIGFVDLFFLNLVLYIILFVFDILFIDGFVLGYWQPSFLNLPEALSSKSMREHIVKSIPVGLVFGLILSGVSTAISFIAFGTN